MKLGVAAVLGFAVALAASAEPPQTKISVFSGKPVPRFESLRYSAVHGRAGPSFIARSTQTRPRSCRPHVNRR
ncbi:MAG: hypothetical protein AAFX03_06315 [Pseudomonadota bacterium]